MKTLSLSGYRHGLLYCYLLTGFKYLVLIGLWFVMWGSGLPKVESGSIWQCVFLRQAQCCGLPVWKRTTLGMGDMDTRTNFNL